MFRDMLNILLHRMIWNGDIVYLQDNEGNITGVYRALIRDIWAVSIGGYYNCVRRDLIRKDANGIWFYRYFE